MLQEKLKVGPGSMKVAALRRPLTKKKVGLILHPRAIGGNKGSLLLYYLSLEQKGVSVFTRRCNVS